MILSLPYPPSVNHYWRQSKGKFYVASEGVAYRKTVWALTRSQGITAPLMCRLAVAITLTMPDRRRRDIDNTLKATLDALAFARVYHDDEQIDRLTIERGNVAKPGGLKVQILPMGNVTWRAAMGEDRCVG